VDGGSWHRYHLVYDDWEASLARQGAALASLIAERWGAHARAVLDVTVERLSPGG
jgi:hypothetical protein